MAADVVPDARVLLADGLRYEKAGLTAEALAAYSTARDRAHTPALRCEAWRGIAHAHCSRSEWADAIAAAQAAQREAQAAHLMADYAEALNAEAAVHQSRGEHDAARQLYGRILELAVTDRMHGIALQNLGTIAARAGSLDEAEHLLDEALRRFTRCGYGRGRAHVLNNRTALLLDRKHYQEALRASYAAVAAALEVEDLELLGIAKLNHAEALGCLDRFAEAEDAASAALGQFEIGRNAWRRMECLRLLGDLAARRSDAEGARRFYGAAQRIAEQIGSGYEADQLRQRLAALPDPA